MKAFKPFGHTQAQPLQPMDTEGLNDSSARAKQEIAAPVAPQTSSTPVSQPPVRRNTFNFSPAQANGNSSNTATREPVAQRTPAANSVPTARGFQFNQNTQPATSSTPSTSRSDNTATSVQATPVGVSLEEKRRRALEILAKTMTQENDNQDLAQQNNNNQQDPLASPAQRMSVQPRPFVNPVAKPMVAEAPVIAPAKKAFQFAGAPGKDAAAIEAEQYKSQQIQHNSHSSGFALADALDLIEPTSPIESTNKEVPVFEAERTTPQFNQNEQKWLEFRALREKVKDIRIREIAKVIGATNKEDKIQNKWKMPWGDNVSIQGQKWFNHNSVSKFNGGRDAISFAKYIMSHEYRYDLDDKAQARKAENRGVYWLGETFGEEIDKSDIIAAKENMEFDFKKPYSVPAKLNAEALEKVKNYLIQERKIPEWVVDKQIAANKLYAGLPNQYLKKITYDNFGKRVEQKRDLENLSDGEIYCVFKSGDDKIGAAECRCITQPSGENFEKGFTEGSHKKQCGFMVLGETGFEEKEITMVEASVDAMSYHALYPWAHTISTGGTDNTDFVLKISREVIDNPTYKLVYAFDNDKAGDHFFDALIAHLKKEFTDEVIDGHLASGKLSRKRTPFGKDWNDYLKTVAVEELYQPPETPIEMPKEPAKKRVKKETVNIQPEAETVAPIATVETTEPVLEVNQPTIETPAVETEIVDTIDAQPTIEKVATETTVNTVKEVQTPEAIEAAVEPVKMLVPEQSTGTVIDTKETPVVAPISSPALSEKINAAQNQTVSNSNRETQPAAPKASRPSFTFQFQKPAVKSEVEAQKEVAVPQNVRKFKF